jgi:hypothetical protein
MLSAGLRTASAETWRHASPMKAVSCPSFIPHKYEKDIPLLRSKCFAGSVFRGLAR